MREMKLRYSVAAVASAVLLSTGAWAESESASESRAIYMAPLQPLNTAVNKGPVTGAAVLVRENDELKVYVRAAGLEPNMMHRQMLHVGSECPTGQADENGDNVVDVMEGIPSYGLVLIPLDENLEQIAEGEFPRTGEEDTLEYSEVASFEALEQNVSGEDDNPDDPIVKLEEGERLDLAGKTIVIHGVSEETDLADSVQGVADVAPHLTVPVACGVIEELG